MSKSWFKISNDVNDPGQGEPVTPDILIHDEIGGFGVQSQDFIRTMQAIKGPCNVRINSGGGDVFQGLAIYNYLSMRGDVTTICDGLAGSAASLVFLGGATRKIPASAFFMIHNPQMAAEGDAEDMRKNADLLDSISQAMASIYSKVSGAISQQDALTLMEDETWFTGLDAKDRGFATEVLEPSPVVASINPKWGYRKTPTALLSSATAGKNTNRNHRMNDTIRSLFGITAGAREKFLAEAIAAVGITNDALASAEKEGKPAFLADHITARLNELDVKAKAALAERDAHAATISAALGALGTLDLKPETITAAIKTKAASIAAETLAARGVPSSAANPPPPSGDKVKAELSGLDLARHLNALRHSQSNS